MASCDDPWQAAPNAPMSRACMAACVHPHPHPHPRGGRPAKLIAIAKRCAAESSKSRPSGGAQATRSNPQSILASAPFPRPSHSTFPSTPPLILIPFNQTDALDPPSSSSTFHLVQPCLQQRIPSRTLSRRLLPRSSPPRTGNSTSRSAIASLPRERPGKRLRSSISSHSAGVTQTYRPVPIILLSAVPGTAWQPSKSVSSTATLMSNSTPSPLLTLSPRTVA